MIPAPSKSHSARDQVLHIKIYTEKLPPIWFCKCPAQYCMLKSSMFLENTNWSLKSAGLTSHLPGRPHTTCTPCTLGHSHNSSCPVNGKECWFLLLYDVGAGGLSVLIFTTDTMTVHRLHLLISHKVTTVDSVFRGHWGMAAWRTCSSLGLAFSQTEAGGRGEAHLVTGERTSPGEAWRWRQPRSARLQLFFYLHGPAYGLGTWMWTGGQVIGNILRNWVFHSTFLPNLYSMLLSVKQMMGML